MYFIFSCKRFSKKRRNSRASTSHPQQLWYKVSLQGTDRFYSKFFVSLNSLTFNFSDINDLSTMPFGHSSYFLSLPKTSWLWACGTLSQWLRYHPKQLVVHRVACVWLKTGKTLLVFSRVRCSLENWKFSVFFRLAVDNMRRFTEKKKKTHNVNGWSQSRGYKFTYMWHEMRTGWWPNNIVVSSTICPLYSGQL